MEAVIFDLDGTLTDSEKVHKKSYLLTLDELGLSSYKEKIAEYTVKNQGTPDIPLIKGIIEEFDLDISLEKFASTKGEIYQNLISTDIVAFDGAVDFVKSVKERYKIAIATSSRYEDMKKGLEKVGLFDVFDVKVSGAKLKNPKPAPDIFLLTAEKLGVDIKKCLIFEDSYHGLKAAKASGAKAIAFDNKEGNKDYLKDYYVVDDYKNLTVDDIEKIYDKMEE